MSDLVGYLKDIPAGLAAAKTAVDLAKSVRDLVRPSGGEAVSKEILAQVQEKLFELTEKNLSVQEDYGKLYEYAKVLLRRVEELESFDEAARNLVLAEVGLHSWAYCASKAEGASPKGPFYCQSCYTTKRLSVLQLDRGNTGHDRLACPVCKATVMVKNDRTIQVRPNRWRVRDGWMA